MRRFALALLTLALFTLSAPARSNSQVEVLLVLAIDASSSVDDYEYALQLDGYAQVFNDSRVTNIMRQYSGTGVLMFEWSDRQSTIVNCMTLRSIEDGQRIARQIAGYQRYRRGGTHMGDALEYAWNEVQKCDLTPDRIVLDISGDGASNGGQLLAPIRERLLTAGWVINTLPIGDENVGLNSDGTPMDLVQWFRENVAGGEGNFTMPADSYENLAVQVRRKIIREWTNAVGIEYTEAMQQGD